MLRRVKGWVLRKYYPDVVNYVIMRISFHPDEASKCLYDEYEMDKHDA